MLLLMGAVALSCFLAGAGIIGCREKLPANNGDLVFAPPLQFMQGDYFVYNNRLYSGFGFVVSQYKSTWTVVDTGRTLEGRGRVAVVIDSVFAPGGALARRDSILFYVDAAGDLYRYGFLAWVAGRESVRVAPRWDRIAAFSVPLGSSWTVGCIDSAGPGRTVLASSSSTPDFVSAKLNGVATVLNAYRIGLATVDRTLDLTLWLTDAPTSIGRSADDSQSIPNGAFMELVEARTGRRGLGSSRGLFSQIEPEP